MIFSYMAFFVTQGVNFKQYSNVFCLINKMTIKTYNINGTYIIHANQ